MINIFLKFLIIVAIFVIVYLAELVFSGAICLGCLFSIGTLLEKLEIKHNWSEPKSKRVYRILGWSIVILSGILLVLSSWGVIEFMAYLARFVD